MLSTHRSGMPLAADIVKSGALRLLGSARRPAPSLFSLPGLEARADWRGAKGLDAAGFRPLADAVRRIEDATDALADEYVEGEGRARGGRSEGERLRGRRVAPRRALGLAVVRRPGAIKPSFAREAPVAARLWDAVPRLMTGVPFGHAFYSALGAGAEIKPHTAPMNLRLRVHVPLMVPEGDVGMRLAGEALTWRRGEALVFDDSFVHETAEPDRGGPRRPALRRGHPDLGDDEVGAVVETAGRRAAAKPK